MNDTESKTKEMLDLFVFVHCGKIYVHFVIRISVVFDTSWLHNYLLFSKIQIFFCN